MSDFQINEDHVLYFVLTLSLFNRHDRNGGAKDTEDFSKTFKIIMLYRRNQTNEKFALFSHSSSLKKK